MNVTYTIGVKNIHTDNSLNYDARVISQLIVDMEQHLINIKTNLFTSLFSIVRLLLEMDF